MATHSPQRYQTTISQLDATSAALNKLNPQNPFFAVSNAPASVMGAAARGFKEAFEQTHLGDLTSDIADRAGLAACS